MNIPITHIVKNKRMTKRVHFAGDEGKGVERPAGNHVRKSGFQFHRVQKLSPPVPNEQSTVQSDDGMAFGDLSKVIGHEKFRSLSELMERELSDGFSECETEDSERPSAFSEIIDDDTLESLSLLLELQQHSQGLQSESRESNRKQPECLECLKEDSEPDPLICAHSSLRFAGDISDREKKLQKKNTKKFRSHLYRHLLSLFNRI
ncbi:hypothetical protein FGB62_52g12 [Gracilaria domingensis]|nr:hypothetical protein FGB62_52g12 [Gracilaria domingensis]